MSKRETELIQIKTTDEIRILYSYFEGVMIVTP